MQKNNISIMLVMFLILMFFLFNLVYFNKKSEGFDVVTAVDATTVPPSTTSSLLSSASNALTSATSSLLGDGSTTIPPTTLPATTVPATGSVISSAATALFGDGSTSTTMPTTTMPIEATTTIPLETTTTMPTTTLPPAKTYNEYTDTDYSASKKTAIVNYSKNLKTMDDVRNVVLPKCKARCDADKTNCDGFTIVPRKDYKGAISAKCYFTNNKYLDGSDAKPKYKKGVSYHYANEPKNKGYIPTVTDLSNKAQCEKYNNVWYKDNCKANPDKITSSAACRSAGLHWNAYTEKCYIDSPDKITDADNCKLRNFYFNSQGKCVYDPRYIKNPAKDCNNMGFNWTGEKCTAELPKYFNNNPEQCKENSFVHDGKGCYNNPAVANKTADPAAKKKICEDANNYWSGVMCHTQPPLNYASIQDINARKEFCEASGFYFDGQTCMDNYKQFNSESLCKKNYWDKNVKACLPKDPKSYNNNAKLCEYNNFYMKGNNTCIVNPKNINDGNVCTSIGGTWLGDSCFGETKDSLSGIPINKCNDMEDETQKVLFANHNRKCMFNPNIVNRSEDSTEGFTSFNPVDAAKKCTELGLYWNGTKCLLDKPGLFNNEKDCNESGALWSPYLKKCVNDPKSFTSESLCTNSGNYWNGINCIISNPSAFTNEDACGAYESNYWNGIKCTNDPNNYTTDATCKKYGLVWDPNAAATKCTSGQSHEYNNNEDYCKKNGFVYFNKRCFPNPANYKTQAACNNPNSTNKLFWDKNVCKLITPNALTDESTCTQLGYKWVNNKCYLDPEKYPAAGECRSAGLYHDGINCSITKPGPDKYSRSVVSNITDVEQCESTKDPISGRYYEFDTETNECINKGYETQCREQGYYWDGLNCYTKETRPPASYYSDLWDEYDDKGRKVNYCTLNKFRTVEDRITGDMTCVA